MTAKEHQELDDWILINVFGWIPCFDHVGFGCKCFYPTQADRDNQTSRRCEKSKRYTTEPAAAMEVLKACAAKANEDEPSSFVSVGCYHTVFQVILIWHNGATTKFNRESQAETLELAICLFAKKLFTK